MKEKILILIFSLCLSVPCLMVTYANRKPVMNFLSELLRDKGNFSTRVYPVATPNTVKVITWCSYGYLYFPYGTRDLPDYIKIRYMDRINAYNGCYVRTQNNSKKYGDL